MLYADSNQCPSERLSRMLPLRYTRQYNNGSNTTYCLMKTHVTVLLARPTFINLSATHNLSGRPFSLKNQQQLLPCFLYKSFFYGPSAVHSRLGGWSYLVKFLIWNLSYSPCSEPNHTVLLLDVMYTMYARHPS